MKNCTGIERVSWAFCSIPQKCSKIACRWIKRRKTSLMCWLVNIEDSLVYLAHLEVWFVPTWYLCDHFKRIFQTFPACRSDIGLQSKAIWVCNSHSHSKWIMIEFSAAVVVVMGRTGTGDVRGNDCGSCSWGGSLNEDLNKEQRGAFSGFIFQHSRITTLTAREKTRKKKASLLLLYLCSLFVSIAHVVSHVLFHSRFTCKK